MSVVGVEGWWWWRWVVWRLIYFNFMLRSIIILTLCWPDCRRSLSPPAPRPEREMTDREKFY